MKIAHESSNETDHNPRNNESNKKLNNLADILDYEDSYNKMLKTDQVNFLEIEDLGIKEQEKTINKRVINIRNYHENVIEPDINPSKES